MFDIALMLSGFLLLIIGGEALVRGSVALAERMGLSTLFIGIALVGFGTSVPELVTSVQASFKGSPGIAIGNFVGSNISNILLIIGTSALLYPLTVNLQGIKRDGSIVLGVAILFAISSALVPLNPIVGSIYLLLLLAYLVSAYQYEKTHANADHPAPVNKAEATIRLADEPSLMSRLHAKYTAKYGWALPFILTVFGLATIIWGGNLLVEGAIGLARSYGIEETVIGLTIVAIGTSMPELATSVIAAIRRQTDVAVGNIIGSNIYNTIGIGGVVGIIAPLNVPHQIIVYDNLIVIAATVALIALAFFGKGTISRVGGFALLGAYVLYFWSVWPI